MKIEIVWGTGEGQTSLSAFDTALAAGGIHNYNLVTLSSVIPEDAVIECVGKHEPQWDIGELVSVILAENESTISGETVAAGLGWATAKEGGVFYEATAETADNVERSLRRGIESAKDIRPDWQWETGFETQITEHTVEENGAAIVSAIYRPV